MSRYPPTATPTRHGLVPPTDSPADSGKVLSQTGWVSTGGGSPHALGSHTDTVITSPADGHVLTYDSGTGKWVNEAPAGGGSGTVTSVALSLPADIFSVSGSPVTASGTLTVAKVNQNANLVYAGPTGGAAAAPAFRALVTADLPAISDALVSFAVTRTANTVLAGPTSGGAAPASYRALVAADIPTGIPAANIAGGTVDDTEFGYLNGVTSGIQTQLAGKVDTTRTISTTAPLAGGGDLSANRTLTISAATTGAAGSMSAADKTKLDAIVQTQARVSGSNVTTTLATAVSVTGLTFTMGASETWSFECYLRIGCSGTGGVKFAVDVPASTTNINILIEGTTSGPTAYTSAIITADATLTSVVFNNVNGQNGLVYIQGCITAPVGGGTVQIQFASTTAGQTSTAYINSYLTARKVA